MVSITAAILTEQYKYFHCSAFLPGYFLPSEVGAVRK
jgi:hypothetical protein